MCSSATPIYALLRQWRSRSFNARAPSHSGTTVAEAQALTRESAVLMIFEDVHWIDPTSFDALGRAVDRIRTLSVLLIVTYRPGYEPPWIGRPHVTACGLISCGLISCGLIAFDIFISFGILISPAFLPRLRLAARCCMAILKPLCREYPMSTKRSHGVTRSSYF